MRLHMHSSNCEGESAASSQRGDANDFSLILLCDKRYVGVDSQQSVGLGEELLLQGDDDDLHVLLGLLSDEAGHLDADKTRRDARNEATFLCSGFVRHDAVHNTNNVQKKTLFCRFCYSGSPKNTKVQLCPDETTQQFISMCGYE